VAKVMQGVLMSERSTVFSPEGMIRLWTHECQRVFSDRFLRTKSNDEARFKDILIAKMNENMGGKEWGSVMAGEATIEMMILMMLLLLLCRLHGPHYHAVSTAYCRCSGA